MEKYIPVSIPQDLLRLFLAFAMTFAGLGHLSSQRLEFQAQVPDWLPFSPDFVVIASGIVEILLGLSLLLLRKHRVETGIALAIFFVLIFPGNIAQYLGHRDAFGLTTDTSRLVRLFFQPVLIWAALWSTGAWRWLLQKDKQKFQLPASVFDIPIQDAAGRPFSLEPYRGKVLLLVNTATKCGLAPQFEELEMLHQKYKDKGLVVLGFPCNQFLSQEPGSSSEVEQTCKINFGVSFPILGKLKVNGSETHPLFNYLKGNLGGWLTDEVRWNFTKFVIDKQGKPVLRYSPRRKPESIEQDLINLLNA